MKGKGIVFGLDGASILHGVDVGRVESMLGVIRGVGSYRGELCGKGGYSEAEYDYMVEYLEKCVEMYLGMGYGVKLYRYKVMPGISFLRRYRDMDERKFLKFKFWRLKVYDWHVRGHGYKLQEEMDEMFYSNSEQTGRFRYMQQIKKQRDKKVLGKHKYMTRLRKRLGRSYE
jgi:hypothetical protein